MATQSLTAQLPPSQEAVHYHEYLDSIYFIDHAPNSASLEASLTDEERLWFPYFVIGARTSQTDDNGILSLDIEANDTDALKRLLLSSNGINSLGIAHRGRLRRKLRPDSTQGIVDIHEPSIFVDRLSDKDVRELYMLFMTFRRRPNGAYLDMIDVIDLWNELNSDQRYRLAKEGAEWPADPRLVDHIYDQDNMGLPETFDILKKEDESIFLLWCGFRAYHPYNRNRLLSPYVEALKQSTLYQTQKTTLRELGRRYHDQYEAWPRRPRLPGSPNDHIYEGSATNVRATDRDIRQVVRDREAAWEFTRTLCQNQHETLSGGVHSHRIVHQFTRYDTNRTPIEQMVVKIIGGDNEKWIDEEWETETNCHLRISGQGCPHILDMYGYVTRLRGQSPFYLRYMYLEYAPYGSLGDLVRALERDATLKAVPEPVLWLIFRGLAEAVLMLQTGRVIAKRTECPPNIMTPRDGWQPLVNADIKLDNVVLGYPMNGYYPAYKTAKMIDFGVCYQEGDRYLVDQSPGTANYWPPEQADTVVYPDLENDYEHHAISIRSEIFNVGLIMLSIMERRFRELEAYDIAEGFRNTRTDRCYSKRLEDAVYSCLNIDPEDRPSLDNLIRAIDRGFSVWEQSYGSVDSPSQSALPDYAKWA